MNKSEYSFEGYISEKDNPSYVARQVLKNAFPLIVENKSLECKLTKRVKATIILEVIDDNDDD